MTIRLPVKFVDGQWELLYGGAVPVKPHTLAELRVDASAISDPHFLKTVTTETRVRILGPDTELLIAMNPADDLSADLKKLLKSDVRHDRTAKISVYSQFATVHLKAATETQKRRNELTGGLWLLIMGMTPCGLESSMVALPEHPSLSGPAASLNHAYTLLSEVFETNRMAHTGSIYEHVFYKDSDGLWHPLKDLRDQELASAERKVIQDLWQNVQAQMPSTQGGLFD